MRVNLILDRIWNPIMEPQLDFSIGSAPDPNGSARCCINPVCGFLTEVSRSLKVQAIASLIGFDHFLRHHSELFPALRRITRTSFVRQSANLCGLKSLKHASRDPHPQRSMALRRIRRRIETVFGQLVDRYGIKRVWARDMWHLSSRLLRKTLSHTIAVMLNQLQGNPPLQISKLVV